MSVQVFKPFELFHDISGKPLDDGQIWIGQPNVDPEGSPISAFFDEALTIPAPQPIRTRNGYISNSGAQAKIFVNATTYSIRVENKNGTIISQETFTGSATDLEERLENGTASVSPGTSIPFTQSSTAPAADPLVESALTVDFGGADSNAVYRIETNVSGATTAGQPTTGYSNAVDLTSDYIFVTSTSGHNQATGNNDGRTGIYAHRTKLVQDGQGDLVAYNASVRITGDAKPGATHWLANPAGVVINGTVIGEATGCYLNPFELFLIDKPNGTAFNTTAVGIVLNLSRNHVSDTQANGGIGQVWAGVRVQSVGTQQVENMISGTGKFFGGVDLSMPALDFGTNKAAMLMKADDRFYFNASAAEQNDGTVFIRANWRATTGFNDYWFYDTAALRWKVVVGGVETLQVSNTQITIPQVNCTGIVLVGNHIQVSGSKVVGARILGYSAFTGALNRGSVYDTSTVTLVQLAERVAAIQADLTSHGLIGA